MILTVVGAVILGVLAGACSDELLRGRDARSRSVLMAGFVGAIGGLAIRSMMADRAWLLEILTALLGALIVAGATRIGISSTLAGRTQRV